jgi:metallo-beta-lactamase class B
VFFGSTTVLEGVKLLNNPKYPNLVADYSATFEKLKALPCDIFLAPHGSFFGLQEKAARLARNEQPNPFIQPREFSEFVVKSERAFQNQLVEEKARNE